MSGSEAKQILAGDECFVVSPIGPQGSETRHRAANVLNHVIRGAALAIDLVARRADDFDAPGSITSQIIQRLLAAKAEGSRVISLTSIGFPAARPAAPAW